MRKLQTRFGAYLPVLCAALALLTTADASGATLDDEDDRILYNLFLESGGAPGEVPVEIDLVGNPKPTPDDFWTNPIPQEASCAEFAYEYTKLIPQQHGSRVRHEHAIVRYSDMQHAVLDIRGYYIQLNSRGDSFSLDYSQKGGNKTNYNIQVNCKVNAWDVMVCTPCLYEDYIVHGNLVPSCREAGSVRPTRVANTTLEALVGVEGYPKYAVPDKINLRWLLQYFGGVVQFDARKVVNPPPNPDDPRKRPLPDAPKSSWLYDFRYNNLPRALRFEHAIRRFQGTPAEFIEIRGVVYWRAHGGDFRVEYLKDDTGLHTTIESADCSITRGVWRCTHPQNIRPPSCGAGVSPGLLASLVGAG